MEVHHHPELHHKKKHFKEYFLEFLMIFLAVTLGFFAENIREYLSDNAKEKQYVHSLYEDMHEDSIIKYEKNVLSYKDNHPTDIQERQSLYPFIASMYDANVFQIMFDSTNHIQRIKGLHTLDISDKKLNNRFIYYLHQAKSTMLAEKISLFKIYNKRWP